MKLNNLRSHNLARPLAVLGAALILGLTCANTARAAVAAGVLANCSRVAINVPALAVSANINLPILNADLMLTASTRDVGSRGTGFATLCQANGFLSWTGLNAAGNAPNVQGVVAGPPVGVNLIAIAPGGQVFVETGSVVNTIRVANNVAAARSVVLEMFW